MHPYPHTLPCCAIWELRHTFRAYDAAYIALAEDNRLRSLHHRWKAERGPSRPGCAVHHWPLSLRQRDHPSHRDIVVQVPRPFVLQRGRVVDLDLEAGSVDVQLLAVGGHAET